MTKGQVAGLNRKRRDLEAETPEQREERRRKANENYLRNRGKKKSQKTPVIVCIKCGKLIRRGKHCNKCIQDIEREKARDRKATYKFIKEEIEFSDVSPETIIFSKL